MPRSYRVVVAFCRLLVRLFFRQVEVLGLEYLPRDRGGILVSWHPNGMMDPGLILTHFPAQVVFGARHGLFRVPLLGYLMRAIGTVPVFRAMDQVTTDPEARQKANQGSLDALAQEVLRGNFSCLFPEGDSHDRPGLLELKTGAARFYYRSRQLGAQERPPVIIPVGLHYDSKRVFRSNALVAFHPPLELPPDLDLTPPDDESADDHRTRCRRLTDEIDRVLREVVHATESWELHQLMHRARKLVRAERAFRAGERDLGPTSMTERTVAFGRIWSGYYARLKTHPEEVEQLVKRLRAYDDDLRALGLQDHDLDRAPRLGSPWLATILLLQVILVFLLLPPILFVGYVVNLPPAALLWVAARLIARKKKDEATIKILGGAVLFPLTWCAVGLLGAYAHGQLHDMFPNIPNTPVLAGVTLAILSIIGGLIALGYARLAAQTMRAVRTRLTRARQRTQLQRLRRERAALFDAFMELAEGLDLPGTVTPEGRVSPS